MKPSSLLAILAEVERGSLTPADAAERLKSLPYEDLGHTARRHHHAQPADGIAGGDLRGGQDGGAGGGGISEPGCERSGCAGDARGCSDRGGGAGAASRCGRTTKTARTVALKQGSEAAELQGHIAVVCAGSSDLFVAEEAAITAETFHARVTGCIDVGVAGIHRLLAVCAVN